MPVLALSKPSTTLHKYNKFFTMLSRQSILLLFPLWIVSAAGNCPLSGCNFGFCTGEKCVCQQGFTASDCSLQYENCPDGKRSCYNGSECARNNEKDPVTRKYKYRCDCSKAFDRSSFAGIQCEHSSTTSCEYGAEASPYAFCTNGGECIKVVRNGAPHEGCECPPDFEGLHCQYALGETPSDDLKETIGIYRGNRGGLEPVVVFFIVAISLGVVGGLGFLIWQKKKNQIETEMVTTRSDLQCSEHHSEVDHDSQII